MKNKGFVFLMACGAFVLMTNRTMACNIGEEKDVNPAAQVSAFSNNCAFSCDTVTSNEQAYSPQDGWVIKDYRAWTGFCTGKCGDPQVTSVPGNYSFNYEEAIHSAESQSGSVQGVDPDSGKPVSVGGSLVASRIRSIQQKFAVSHATITIRAQATGERAYGANGKHTVALATKEICIGTADDYRRAVLAELEAGKKHQEYQLTDTGGNPSASSVTFEGKNWGDATSQQMSGTDDMRGWSWDGHTASYPAINPSGKTILYIRSFDGKTWGEPTSQQMSGTDDMRGWSWDGRTASYPAINASGKTILYIRSFDGKNWGEPTSQQMSSTDDMRGWSWNGRIASYLAVNASGKTILYIRSFDGKTWGEPTSQQMSGSNDMRGWSWDGRTASYPSINPSGKTILYIRSLR